MRKKTKTKLKLHEKKIKLHICRNDIENTQEQLNLPKKNVIKMREKNFKLNFN